MITCRNRVTPLNHRLVTNEILNRTTHDLISKSEMRLVPPGDTHFSEGLHKKKLINTTTHE